MPAETKLGPTAKPVRILLVDDHPMVRQGIISVLAREDDFEVCGEAGTAAEAHEMARSLKPEVAVVDLALPDADGLELIKDLHTRYPDMVLLVLSMRDEELYAERALRAGARGYLMKGKRPRQLVEAIRTALDGGVYLSETMASRLMRRLVDTDAETAEASPVESLSDRELQVFTLIGAGLGPTRIAEKLHLSVKTIETYRAHIKRKLNLPDAAALRRCAIEWAQSNNPA
ncbi:MAG: response regulator [Planctomycetota bacterium]